LDGPFALQQIWVFDFRNGSKADVTLLNFDFRFTPESRHWSAKGAPSSKQRFEPRILANDLKVLGPSIQSPDMACLLGSYNSDARFSVAVDLDSFRDKI
jgi:hypothetical protein